MKKFLLLAGVACLFAANAQAEVSQYVSGKASLDFNKVKIKDADFESNDIYRWKSDKNLPASHLAYGAKFGFVRGEVELNNAVNMKRNTLVDNRREPNAVIDKFELYKHSLMANVYFDYLTCTPWTPYVGAGLGTSYLKMKFNDTSKSAINLAWQVMGGITYDLNAEWTLDLGYRYADLGRVRKNYGSSVVKTTVRDHEILFGARYSF